MVSDQVKKLEELGDNCVGKDNYGEAVLHYTHALKLEPNIYRIIDKRCKAFHKMGQYYYSYEDAKELIKLSPNNPTGYIKKAVVEYDTNNYREALASYRKASHLISGKDSAMVHEAIRRCKEKFTKQESSDKHLPWIGAAIGLVVGMALVVADYMVWMNNGFLKNPLIKVALIISNSYMFYHTLKWYRSYISSCRLSLLQPPPSLFPDDEQAADWIKSKDN